jgi:hypothetical protein
MQAPLCTSHLPKSENTPKQHLWRCLHYSPIFDDILNYKTALWPAASSHSTLMYHNINISVSVLLSLYHFNCKTTLYPPDSYIFLAYSITEDYSHRNSVEAPLHCGITSIFVTFYSVSPDRHLPYMYTCIHYSLGTDLYTLLFGNRPQNG